MHVDGVAQNRKEAAREATARWLLSDEFSAAIGNTEKCVRINTDASGLGIDVSINYVRVYEFIHCLRMSFTRSFSAARAYKDRCQQWKSM